MDWRRVFAYITGTVDQELPLRNEYLVAENHILKAQLDTRLRVSDVERATLGEIAHRLGRKVLECVANATRSDTILGVVQGAGRPQIRWFQGPSQPRPAESRCENRATHYSHGQGKSELGL